MKKIYIFLCVIMSFFCSSCSIFKGQYIDIAELYYERYNYYIIDELNRDANHVSTVKVSDVLLFTKEDYICNNRYDEMKNAIGMDFVNMIFIQFEMVDESNYEYYLGVIELESKSDAKKYKKNRSTIGDGEFWEVKNNICYLGLPGIYILLGNCKMEVHFKYNSGKNILIRGEGLSGMFHVPENVEKINHFSCHNYTISITDLICNASLEYIGVSAFYGVDTLKYVYFNSKIEVIEGNSFYDCPIEYVIIPKSVKYIGIGAFSNGNIFCEVSSKPDEWHKDFVVQNAKVYWAGEWEYNEDGIPVAIDK